MTREKSEIKVVVEGKSETPTRINIKSGKFSMTIDEPEQMGGTDLGPTPMQALLMALAGCLNITGNFVARQKNMEINNMSVRIEGTMNPSVFMGMSSDGRAGFSEIEVHIDADFPNSTDQEIDEWVRETEKRFPVTDNIKDKTRIVVHTRELNNK
ncbi:MAG: OsmC family protein [Bacteroidales bacterium]|nr:OsmC family protein [Bacteroidales bacterium]